jgi:hypothetical protein
VVGGVLQLRSLDLAPGASATITVPGRVECGSNHTSYPWTLVVKQANDFNGTGNDLAPTGPTTNTVTGNCAIVFSKQPKSAEKHPTAITNAVYNPAGDPVTVTVKDGAGTDTVAWWSGSVALAIQDDPTGGLAAIGGTASGTAVSGSVTFAPTINKPGTGFSLNATATPDAGASTGTSTSAVESDNFNIVDDAAICSASNQKCNTHSQGPKTDVTIEAGTGGQAGDLVILAINDPTVTVDCAGYTETSDVITYNVTDSGGSSSANRPKLATFTLGAAFVTQAASKYEMCYSSPTPFKNKAGVLVTTGLLPNCVNKTLDPAPCVVSKALDKSKNLVLVVSSPPGDPQGKF